MAGLDFWGPPLAGAIMLGVDEGVEVRFSASTA